MKLQIYVCLILTSAIALTPVRVIAAEKFTAICGEPKGSVIAQMNGKLTESDDKITGAKPTYSWDANGKQATVVIQHSEIIGGSPLSFDATVFAVTPRQVAFLIHYEDGIELHSLFLDTGDLYISAQKDWSKLVPNGSTGKVLHAQCRVGKN